MNEQNNTAVEITAEQVTLTLQKHKFATKGTIGNYGFGLVKSVFEYGKTLPKSQTETIEQYMDRVKNTHEYKVIKAEMESVLKNVEIFNGLLCNFTVTPKLWDSQRKLAVGEEKEDIAVIMDLTLTEKIGISKNGKEYAFFAIMIANKFSSYEGTFTCNSVKSV